MIIKIHETLYHGETSDDIVRVMASVSFDDTPSGFMARCSMQGRLLAKHEIRHDTAENFISDMVKCGLAEIVTPEKIDTPMKHDGGRG